MKDRELLVEALRMLAVDEWSDSTALLMSDDELLARLQGPGLQTLIDESASAKTTLEIWTVMDKAIVSSLREAWEVNAGKTASLETATAAETQPTLMEIITFLPSEPQSSPPSTQPVRNVSEVVFYDVANFSHALSSSEQVSVSNVSIKSVGVKTSFSCLISGRGRNGRPWDYLCKQDDLPSIPRGASSYSATVNTLDGPMQISMDLRQL